ncbi:unnamed protein product [Moneuplotes crassus]|uniref:Uncharacterized protein n=1 Tax=Euplotes crassus TaxID=5936 RepID=A0AAD1XHP5_EUPCR|nr:unnamed protein product [Moneuplotes crassus]
MATQSWHVINGAKHYPVLYREVLAFYNTFYPQYWEQRDSGRRRKTNYFYLADGTFGGGNHSKLLLNQFKQMKIAGYDLDPSMIEKAEKNFEDEIYSQKRLQLVNDNFINIETYDTRPPRKFNSIFLDLGFSQYQVADQDRGFSYLSDGYLDMRYAPDRHAEGSTAADILNKCTHYELVEIFKRYDPHAEKIAEAICDARERSIINTASDLKNVLFDVFPGLARSQKYNKIMKVFMALRISVNNELIVLDEYLYKNPVLGMAKNGSMVIISFHSTEDQVVAKHFRRWKKLKYGQEVFKKVLTPSKEELEENPASRSAKMRVFMKEFD